jgi:hypothetical protein
MVFPLLLIPIVRELVELVMPELDLHQLHLGQTFMSLQTVVEVEEVRPQMLPQLQTEGLVVKKQQTQVYLASPLP